MLSKGEYRKREKERERERKRETERERERTRDKENETIPKTDRMKRGPWARKKIRSGVLFSNADAVQNNRRGGGDEMKWMSTVKG
jgi:hypothetical protein